MICTDCPKRAKCKHLCYRAEEYVNQDNDDEPWINISSAERIEQLEAKTMETVSTTEAILQNYFIDRMTVKEIAEKHCKSRQYVHKLIKKFTKILSSNIKKSIKRG
jgi:DNA-directed RNA polymerase specialized sigma subunit